MRRFVYLVLYLVLIVMLVTINYFDDEVTW